MTKRQDSTARVDHGARGPANRVRPQRNVETIQAGVTAKLYEDAHLIDRLRAASQIGDRQHAAAVLVLGLHEDAGFEPGVCAGYTPAGFGRGHDDESDEHPAVKHFRDLLGGVSSDSAWLLHSMCLGQHPGVSGLGALQAVLDDLVKRWGC